MRIKQQRVSAIVNGETVIASWKETDDSCPSKVLLRIQISAGGSATGTVAWFLQDSINGETWDDVISSNTFALGAGAITQRFAVAGDIAAAFTQGSAVNNLSLAAGTVRVGPLARSFRVVEKVSGASGSPVGCTYTIGVEVL